MVQILFEGIHCIVKVNISIILEGISFEFVGQVGINSITLLIFVASPTVQPLRFLFCMFFLCFVRKHNLQIRPCMFDSNRRNKKEKHNLNRCVFDFFFGS